MQRTMLCQVRFKNRCRQLALDDYKVVDTAVDCTSNDADQPYNDSVFLLFYLPTCIRLSDFFFPDFGVPVLVIHNRNLRRERPISYLKEKANSHLEKISSPEYGLIYHHREQSKICFHSTFIANDVHKTKPGSVAFSLFTFSDY